MKDLGAATAYAYAVEEGYTGTEEEFAALMADFTTAAETATAAAEAAEAAAASLTVDDELDDESTNPVQNAIITNELSSVKDGLQYGNLNQQIKNPFEIYSANNPVGTIRNNRSSVEILNNGTLKATDTSSTSVTYGFYIEFMPYSSSIKLYVAFKGLVANYTNFMRFRTYITQNGATISGGTSVDFTENDYYIIFTLPDVDTSKKLQLNLLAVDSAQDITGYFTVDAIQVVDLTEMFGSGKEPSITDFNAVYASDMPYPQLLPDVSIDTKAIEYALNKYADEIPYEVIDTIDQMSTVTKDRVLVLHNNSTYGDGGACWFEYLGYATEYGYARADGGKMYPMLDQGALLPSAPPVKNIVSLVSSYVENSDLVYGQTNSLFDTTTTNNIDCCSFVNAVLHGISYFTSKYVASSNKSMCKVCSYDPNPSYTFGYASSRQMAQYFAEQKTLYKMPTSEAMRRILSVGDIIFTGSGLEEFENRFLKIDHVFIVLALLDNDRVIIAQCGGCPSAMTERNNSSTVGKISTIILSNENIATYCKAFARPAYINAFNSDCTGLNLKPSLVPNVYVNTLGAISSSGLASATPGLIEVIPNSVISFTGTKAKDNISYFTLVTEYDQELQFISRTDFTNNNITLGATTRYIRITYGHSNSGDGAMTLKETNLFEATLTNP